MPAAPTPDFALLFAALPAPHAVLAPDGTVLALNTALAERLPEAAPTLPGQPLAALHAAAAARGIVAGPEAAWQAALHATRASIGPALVPDPVEAPQPGAPYWQATFQPVPAGPGPQLVLLRLLDLSEQLRGLALSSADEGRMQAESIPQQVWTATPDGVMDFFNHRTAEYLGEAMDVRGAAHWPHHVHPDDRATVRERWAQALANGRFFEAEFRLRRYDGQYRWFLSQAQARHDAEGHILKWYGTNTNIHDQRALQLELARREMQFRFLAESVPQIVWTAPANGHPDYLNRRGIDYLGRRPNLGAPLHTLWDEWLHPDDITPALQAWAATSTAGTPFSAQFRLRRHDGQYRWFLAQAQPQRNASGAITKWYGTCTDIDDQKQAQQQLEQQNARLLRTNADLDNFVYTASHDLRQPIHNMAGIFEELTRTAYFRDPDAVKLIAYFERALGEIYATIEDLSAIVQVQRQQTQVPPEDVAVEPLVADIINGIKDQVDALHATFDLDFATCPVVHFVRPNLRSILYNLISNSLKYAAPHRPPHVRISSAPTPDTGRPVLTVQDNGMGIDLERFGPQLFQLFRRFHTHTEGSGMGLYLVNRIVQDHGGRLEVDSAVDQGTTFRIFLP